MNKIGFLLMITFLMISEYSSGEQDVNPLEEVVVSATRIGIPKKHLTQSINTVEDNEIKEQQVTDLQEILRDVPGVSVTQTGSRGGTTSLFVRGGNADHNLVLVDGVRVNQAGGSFDWSQIPTDNIERIEVLKGPQSALYGSDAMASVVHIITKKGRGPVQTNVSYGAGNYGTFEEKISVSGGVQEGGFSLAASRVDTDGILELNNRFKETAFSGGFDQKLFDRFNLVLTARYIDSYFEFPTESAGDRLQAALDPHQYNKRRRLVLSSALDSSIFSWWDHKLTLGLQDEDRLSVDPRDTGVDTADVHTNSDEIRPSVDYQWSFRLPALGPLEALLTTGFAWEKELFEQTSRRTTTSTTITQIDQSRNNHAYFFQNQWNYNDILFVIPGMRIEQNETYGTEINPHISAGFILPATQTKIRGSYAEGIKEPSFLQNFGSATILPNPDLRPERVKSWEVGIDQYLSRDVMEINVTYFFNQYNDLIAFISSAEPFRNIQEAESSGVESSLKVAPSLWKNYETSLVLSYTYLETKALDDGGVGGTLFTPGEPLLRRPKHRGAVTFNLSHERFNLNLNTTFQGESIDRDFSKSPAVRVRLPSYAKTDLALTYVIAKKIPELKIFTKIENLFGVDYEEVYGFSTAGIKFLSGIGAKF